VSPDASRRRAPADDPISPRSPVLTLVAPEGPLLAVTRRCAREDLREHGDRSFDELVARHKIVAKFAQLRRQRADGQEIIQSLRAGAPIWSLHFARFRAATIEDRVLDVVWLLAAWVHREGDRDDAYDYFKRLHDADELLPTEEDIAALIERRNAAVMTTMVARLLDALEIGRREPGIPHTLILPQEITMTILVERVMDPDLIGDVLGVEEIWVALPRSALASRHGLVEVILGALSIGAADQLWELGPDFPGRDLDASEIRYRLLQDVLQ
jgi:hypothetical protein